MYIDFCFILLFQIVSLGKLIQKRLLSIRLTKVRFKVRCKTIYKQIVNEF